MKYDDLIKPISGDAPCGPDLLEEGDDAYLKYYYDAEAKMPDRYISIATGERFDPKEIDLRAESKEIEALLKRTRDLRLLALEARFSALAGRIRPFCECVIAMGALLENCWEDVHPKLEGDGFERQAAIEFLDTRATVISPLDYAAIVTDRRAGDITNRLYLLATGEVNPREGEAAGDMSTIMAALGSPDNAQDVEAVHERLKLASEALGQISKACADNGAHIQPSLDNVKKKIADILKFVTEARSDLADDDGADAADAGDEGEGDAGAAASSADGTAAPARAAPAGSITSHADALTSLQAVEAYLVSKEPSAPALILVTQARQLVGEPLVAALELLLAESAEQAVIDLDSESGFSIPMHRMRTLSEEARATAAYAEDAAAPEPREVTSRDQALAEMKAVEGYFQTSEPTSPIPILMFKARSFSNRDFQSIVRDLLPKPEEGKDSSGW